MIPVDTAVWIDHLHANEPRLVELLNVDQVGCHYLIVEEIALGSITPRDVVLELLGNLCRLSSIDHHDPELTNRRKLRGRGLSCSRPGSL